MGQVSGISGNTGAQPFQPDPSVLLGYALMSAVMSNDPQQMMGSVSQLAPMDPRQLLMMLGAMTPQLFGQLASALMGQPVGGGCPACGGPNAAGGMQQPGA